MTLKTGLVMHTFLLHKSAKNVSNSVRWTGQFRIGDLTHKNTVKNGWSGGMLENIDFGIHHSKYLKETNESN